MSYKRFPPPNGHIIVPVSSKEQALAGLSLYTPSLRRGLLLRFTAERLVQTFGPGLLPGRRFDEIPASIVDGWQQIEALLQQELGPFEAAAVHTRRRPHRPGAAVLLLSGADPVAFVKVGPDPGIENEHRVLSQMDRSGEPTAFEVPLPLGFHRVGENGVAAMTALSCLRHRPVPRPPLAAIVGDVQRILRHLPRPAGTPGHWVPAHGDLSPWNLRVDSAGRVFLFDWEEAGFAPPGTDEVYYAMTSGALGLGRPEIPRPSAEALRLWRERLEARPPGRLRRSMMRQLLELEHS